MKRTRGHKSASPVVAGGIRDGGGTLWIVVPLCLENLWKEADAHFKYRRLATQATPGADTQKSKFHNS